MEKYWIKKGMAVRHDSIDSDLTVERILYKNVTMKDGSKKKYTIGVKCHWIINGFYNQGVFHTKELKPKDGINAA